MFGISELLGWLIPPHSNVILMGCCYKLLSNIKKIYIIYSKIWYEEFLAIQVVRVSEA